MLSEDASATGEARAALLRSGDARDVQLVPVWGNTGAECEDVDMPAPGGVGSKSIRLVDASGGDVREYGDAPLHNAMMMIDGVADGLRERADGIRRAMRSREV